MPDKHKAYKPVVDSRNDGSDAIRAGLEELRKEQDSESRDPLPTPAGPPLR